MPAAQSCQARRAEHLHVRPEFLVQAAQEGFLCTGELCFEQMRSGRRREVVFPCNLNSSYAQTQANGGGVKGSCTVLPQMERA